MTTHVFFRFLSRYFRILGLFVGSVVRRLVIESRGGVDGEVLLTIGRYFLLKRKKMGDQN